MRFLVLEAVDLSRVKAMLGSGDEKFCAALLKTLPKPVATPNEFGLVVTEAEVRDWSRAVCALLLGAEGQAMSERELFTERNVVKAGPAMSKAVRSVLESLTQGLPASLVYSGEDPFWKTFMRDALDWIVGKEANPGRRLFRRPLFGLESDGLPSWGGLSRAEVAALAAKLPASVEEPNPEMARWYAGLLQKVGEACRDGLDLVAFSG